MAPDAYPQNKTNGMILDDLKENSSEIEKWKLSLNEEHVKR